MDASSVAVQRVDRARVDAWLGRLISALLIAILMTAPLLFGALRDQDFFWIQMLGVLAGTAWVVRLWLAPRPIFLPPIVWPLVAFCVYAIIRYYTSDVEYLARKEVIRVLFYMMFFVLALNHFRDAKAADIAIAILLALGMALSVWALRQYLAGSEVVWHLLRSPIYTRRGSGTFIYPNHFAAFAEMLLALGFGYVFLGTWSKWVRIFLAYCSLWLVAGIYVSLSRAGWIAALAALLILMPVLLRNRRQQIVTFAMSVILLVAGLLWELNTHKIANRFKDVMARDVTGFHARFALWTGAYQMWQDHLLWGGGPGHFDERFRAYRVSKFQLSAGQAHCDYLNVLADWGVVGGVLLFGALGFYLWPLTRHWIKTVLDPTALNTMTTNDFALTCGGFAGTLGLLAHSFVDYQWYAPGVMLLFIAIVAMLISHIQGGRWNFTARVPVSVVLAPLLLLQAVQGAKSAREQYWINEAHRAVSMEDRIAKLERAFDADPFSFRTAYWTGESYRMLSFEGAPGYKEVAEKAIQWLDRSAHLNRFDPYPHMRKAMCLDWLKRHTEAEAEIQKALALDPEHYLVLAIAGWHYYQVGDDAKALKYLLASHDRNWSNNPVMRQYLRLVEERTRAKGQ